MIQPSRSASRLLATLEIHCPACDQTSQHRLLEPPLQLKAGASTACLLVCAGCGSSQSLTSREKHSALEYIATNQVAP